ncbi:MAG: hypothetical protein Q8R53_03695 [Nanoarchaeota archaeon]|nr:hypothetical protein [Nanoarchaeota archaeon]
MMKNVEKMRGGLAALLTACSTTSAIVQEPEEVSPEVQAEEPCYCPPGGNTGLAAGQINDIAYILVGHDHDCDGTYTTGELHLTFPLTNPDGSVLDHLMVMTPFGLWLDANGDGQPQYEEFTLKNNGPYGE